MAQTNSSILDHNAECYRRRWVNAGYNRYNGAFFYSREIVQNIIPKVKTGRNWVTINSYGVGVKDHSIVFIHNNLHPQNYEWLKKFDDMILVCGLMDTCDKVKHLGRPLYLPLSVDVKYVEQFKRPKIRDKAFAGRRSKAGLGTLPRGVDYLSGLSRTKLLERMAEYKTIYAVGRTAIEAKVLGCKIGVYDNRFPTTTIWKVVDNKDAAKILQRKLRSIDG